MERGKYLTAEEIRHLCTYLCGKGIYGSLFCAGCPVKREGRRDRTEYFKKYYQEKTKKKRQEAKHELSGRDNQAGK